MDYKKAKLDSTQLEYLAQAEKLQAELLNAGFMASRIEKGENRCEFSVIYFDGQYDYVIRRDYNQNIIVFRKDYVIYPNVSSYTRAEIYKKYKDGNTKVLTAKKLQNKIDLENAYHNEMQAKEDEARNNIQMFLDSLNGLDFTFWREKHEDKQSPIKSGECVKNGIEYSFEIGQDGYISKKIKVHYSVDNTLENFIALSNNKYR